MTKEIKALFFDFGNVIYLADQMIAYRTFAKYSRFSTEEIYQKIFVSGIEKIPDEGGSFDEFYFKSLEAIEVTTSNLPKDIFLAIWCDIFRPYPGIEKVLECVKPNIKMILVSNTNAVHWYTTMSKLPLIEKYFYGDDKQVLSFLVGERKPSNLMWQAAIQKVNCSPEETLFIDDNYQFVESYKKFGGNAFQYNGLNDPIEMLIDESNKYKIF